MAIKDRILNFIKTNENFTPSQIAEALNLNKNTVRGRLSELRKEYDITKREIKYERKKTKKEIEVLKEEKREIEEPEEVEKIQWYRKTVKTGGSDRRTKRTDTWESFYAITWEDNKIDRTDDLLDWLQMEFPNKSFHESGYEKSEIEETDEFPEVTFPEIIGGTE